jgi:TetR/AcrR family transcriptional regulator of autoinduction and epiphytic fitness
MADESTESDRRRQVLDAALAVFARYGFRKTSMEEVARAADISRQGLYLHFRDKQALFRATIGKMLDDGLAAVDAELARDAPIGPRLYGAMKAWYGRSVGTPAENADELLARSVALLRDAMERSGAAVVERLTQAIAASPLAARLAERGLTPADAAQTLEACGLGLKHAGLTRGAFKARLAAAVSLAVGAPVQPA